MSPRRAVERDLDIHHGQLVREGEVARLRAPRERGRGERGITV